MTATKHAKVHHVLNVHEYAIEIPVGFEHVKRFLTVRRIQDSMTVQSQPLSQDNAVDVIIL